MEDTTLLNIINNHFSNSTGDWHTEVAEQRADAMKAYFQEPYGNEVEGKSQIVTSEVADTIEWFLPSLMKVFTQGGEVARFTPSSTEDVTAAQQETDAINYLFYKKMDGFNILYSWFKDALIQKNGIAKFWYDDRKTTSTEEYKGLTEEEFTQLAADPELEPEEWELDELSGELDVKFKRTVDESCPVIDVITPEKFYINPEYEHLPLWEAPFAADETDVRASDLIEMGYSKIVVDAIPSGDDNSNREIETDARFSDIGSEDPEDSDGSGDPSMRKIQIADCYLRVDTDGDGIAELRRIVVANRTHILSNEECAQMPYVSITPVPMPHRFFGRSIADQTMDLQLQKTTLLRNILDNLYLINNQRTIVLEGGANIDDLLVSRAGGIAREYTPNAIRPFPTTPFTGHPYEMLEYFDGMKEARTGITKYNQGLDANSLNKTASGMNMIMDASQSRIELVARIFADGVAKLFSGLHGLMLRNQNAPMIMQIRGKFVPIDPRQWRERTDMTVTVGLGTSNDEYMVARLEQLLQLQQSMMQMGFVQPQHIHNTLSKLVESMGLKEVDMFFLQPDQAQPPPQQPDPQTEIGMGQVQAAMMANQINQEDNQMDFQIEQGKLALAKEKNDIEKAKLLQKTADDQADNVFNLTKLEVDSGKNVPGSKV